MQKSQVCDYKTSEDEASGPSASAASQAGRESVFLTKFHEKSKKNNENFMIFLVFSLLLLTVTKSYVTTYSNERREMPLNFS